MDRKTGKVYIVGAGCGNADLITVRGLRLMEKCTAVVYDDLIAPELLDAAPSDAQRIYMGKRSGKHSASQEEICAELIRLAEDGQTVVRLKGGDPFVFGRGGEEIMALQEAGIPFEEVPGISSSIAIPAAAGIPVTHRGLSRSVHIITAHTADSSDGLPEYMTELAKLPGTLVFLMGLSKLRLLAKRLISEGKRPDTPCAVLSGGNSPHHASVRGILADIADRAEAAGVRPPAVIVVGEVAALDLNPQNKLPLAGISIGITGTPTMAGKLRNAFEEYGAKVVTVERSLVKELPVDIVPLLKVGGERKLLVFTSSNGVEVFFSKLRQRGFDLRGLSNCSFAVIGRATGDTLAKYGFTADICPEKYTSRNLAAEIEKHWNGGEIFLLRSNEGSKPLYDRLSLSLRVRDIPIYTVARDERIRFGNESVDYLCFSSAGGVKCFFSARNEEPLTSVPVVIGEVTYSELLKHYSGRVVISDECTADGMVRAILEDSESKGAL